jgi:small subunit ribosomal protein S20
MANIKSQKKRNLQNETRRVRNKGVRSELKTRIKVAQDGVASGAEDADEQVRIAQRRLGKAGSKGIIHKNQAARRTSRLMKKAGTTAS